jgi:hypothetical protein
MSDSMPVIDDCGTRYWTDAEGRFHREGAPAIMYTNGKCVWYHHGLTHRDGGPAMYEPGLYTYWYKYDKLHRVGGPAVETHHGRKEWWFEGEQHREDGPALVTSCGIRHWYRHGLLHNTSGPARIVVESDSGYFGKRPQLDEFYVNGKPLTEREFYLYVDTVHGDVLVPPGKKLQYEGLWLHPR